MSQVALDCPAAAVEVGSPFDLLDGSRPPPASATRPRSRIPRCPEKGRRTRSASARAAAVLCDNAAGAGLVARLRQKRFGFGLVVGRFPRSCGRRCRRPMGNPGSGKPKEDALRDRVDWDGEIEGLADLRVVQAVLRKLNAIPNGRRPALRRIWTFDPATGSERVARERRR